MKLQVCHLDEGDGPLGAAGAHPAAHGELLAHPRGALVLPALHVRHPQPLPELPHGLARRPRRRGCGGGGGGLRRGAETLPPPRGSGGERRRTREWERERGERGGLGNLEPARGQAEQPGGGCGRHRQRGGGGGPWGCKLNFLSRRAYLLLLSPA